jgi:hypothetical protein
MFIYYNTLEAVSPPAIPPTDGKMKKGVDAPIPELKSLTGILFDRLYQLVSVHRPA